MARQDNKKTAILYRMVMPGHTCPYGLKSRNLMMIARAIWMPLRMLGPDDPAPPFPPLHTLL